MPTSTLSVTSKISSTLPPLSVTGFTIEATISGASRLCSSAARSERRVSAMRRSPGVADPERHKGEGDDGDDEDALDAEEAGAVHLLLRAALGAHAFGEVRAAGDILQRHAVLARPARAAHDATPA